MFAGCALEQRIDWIFSDLHAWEPVRGAVFRGGEEGDWGSGGRVFARGIYAAAVVAAGEHSSPWAEIFSAGIGQESHGKGFVARAADGPSAGEGGEIVWGLRKRIMDWMRRGW